MDILQQHETGFLEITPWKNTNVIAGFSTRQDGFSSEPYKSMNLGIHVQDHFDQVINNRKRFSEWIGRDLTQWKSLNQIHSNDIIDLSQPNVKETDFQHNQPQIDADGLLTNNKQHVLTAFYADCVPLLFRSKDSGWIGIAHAGWKGTVKEIGPNMVSKFTDKGIKPHEIEVVIGPCISKDNYEVDQRVVNHIPEKFYAEVLTPTTEGHYLLDLKRLNLLYLVEAGVNEEDIYTTDYCTYNDEALFYSHRRDQGKTGRMMAFIYLKNI